MTMSEAQRAELAAFERNQADILFSPHFHEQVRATVALLAEAYGTRGNYDTEWVTKELATLIAALIARPQTEVVQFGPLIVWRNGEDFSILVEAAKVSRLRMELEIKGLKRVVEGSHASA